MTPYAERHEPAKTAEKEMQHRYLRASVPTRDDADHRDLADEDDLDPLWRSYAQGGLQRALRFKAGKRLKVSGECDDRIARLTCSFALGAAFSLGTRRG